MNYIYCGAHRPLLFAMALKNLGNEITVVTYDKEIIKFCAVENIDYIEFEFIELTITSIYRVFTLRKILDDVIEKIDFGEEDGFFIVGNRTKAYDAFYLAKELSKKGVVYYKDITSKPNKYERPKFRPFFRGDIIRFVLKYVLGLDLIYYELNNIPLLGIDHNFLKKYHFEEYAPEIPSERFLLESIKKGKNNCKDYNNLIILGDLTSQGQFTNDHIKTESIKMLYKQMLELPIDFSFKKHPDAPATLSFYEIFNNCEEIPTYIPAEFLYPNVKKNVISVYSISLLTASQLEHLKAISLLELVEWERQSWKSEMKDWLTQESNNRILFPKSFEELKDIILDDGDENPSPNK